MRSRALKCSVKPYVTGLSTKCYFNEFFVHAGSLHVIKCKESIVVRFRSGHGLSGFVLGLFPRGGF